MRQPTVLRRATQGGTRRGLFLLLGLAGLWSVYALDLRPADLVPGPGGLALAREFLSRALSPALQSEARFVPVDTPPLLALALEAAWQTLLYALAALGGALILGLGLGFLAASGRTEDASGRQRLGLERGRTAGNASAGGVPLILARLRFMPGPLVRTGVRTLLAVLRSIHELVWAVLFLIALGRSELGAVLAIALPYAGVLGKVFAELIDEAPRDAARALRGAGASSTQVFCFALLPSALPDMLAYTFYRLECAIRSSAILGFFGFPTLGLYIRQSFASTNYGEVWTYLYVLIALVLIFDVWSGAMRRRMMA